MTPLEEDILKSCRLKNGLCNCKETACGVYCEMEMKTPITPLEEGILKAILESEGFNTDEVREIKNTYPGSFKNYESYAKIAAKIARERIEKEAIEFAKYMETEAWEVDYREQKTHTAQEHYKLFSSRQNNIPTTNTEVSKIPGKTLNNE